MAESDSNDALKFYLQELASIPPLTKAEETVLLRQLQTQDEKAELAVKRLIEANLLLVVSIAERYSAAGPRVLDLVQKGNEGLLAAIKTFQGNSATNFSSHAASCIEAAIANAIAESQSSKE